MVALGIFCSRVHSKFVVPVMLKEKRGGGKLAKAKELSKRVHKLRMTVREVPGDEPQFHCYFCQPVLLLCNTGLQRQCKQTLIAQDWL